MITEINKDYYCTANECWLIFGRQECVDYAKKNKGEPVNCRYCHLKWPTPQQFKDRYRLEYPNNGAVYYFIDNEWQTYEYGTLKKENLPIVCACTPWGKPPYDWRPES